MYKVGIIMGSDSDLNVMNEAVAVLEELGVENETTIVSAHRTPDRLVTYAKEASNNGIHVIIAGAGGAAHLPGMVASMTHLPSRSSVSWKNSAAGNTTTSTRSRWMPINRCFPRNLRRPLRSV